MRNFRVFMNYFWITSWNSLGLRMHDSEEVDCFTSFARTNVQYVFSSEARRSKATVVD